MTRVDKQNSTEWRLLHRRTQFPLRTAVLRVAEAVDRRARCLMQVRSECDARKGQNKLRTLCNPQLISQSNRRFCLRLLLCSALQVMCV